MKEAAALTRRSTAGNVVREKAKRLRSNGSLVDVQILGVPISADGKLVGSFGMYEDITERRRAEQAQSEAEERFRSLFENATEGIFQSTTDGRYLSVNPALARMCGFASPSEMISSVEDLGKEIYADPNVRVVFKRLIEKYGSVKDFEYEVRRRDGAKIWISENAHVVRNPDGEILSYEGTIEDITARKRAELERQVTFEIIHAVNVTDNLDDLLRPDSHCAEEGAVRGELFCRAV